MTGLAGASPRFSGAILTGGASTRMRRDKATAVEVDGRPLVEIVAGAIRGAGAAEVLAIGGDRQALGALGLDVRTDRFPGEGPLGGILTAFEAAAHPLVVVVACDLPLLTPDALRALVAGAGVDGAAGVDVALASGQRREPLCGAWWVPRCRAVLERAFGTGERAVHRAIAGLRVRDVALDPALLRNVNRPGDLPSRAGPPSRR